MAPTPKPKDWAVLVWIAGDNNLDSYGLSDIGEMKQVGSTARVDVAVQFDRAGRNGTTRRYHLQKGTSLEADQVQELGETNTGDPNVAADFFTWGIQTYPSKKILAVMWNHGSGIDETDIYARAAGHGVNVARRVTPRRREVPRSQVRAIATSGLRRSLFSTTIDKALVSRAIAYDDTSRDFLDNAELKRVLARVAKKTGRTIDILGFDACLMNMVEVAYQLRGLVGHIAGSEETEPGDGWPYQAVLEAINARPGSRGSTVARAIVRRYLASYKPASQVTYSAVDVTRVGAVAKAVDELAGACLGGLVSDTSYGAFTRALRATQRFELRDFVDLGDFCKQLVSLWPNPAVATAARSVLASIDGSSPLVIAEGHKGTTVQRATGVAIYFPTAGDVQLVYPQLDFARDTRWGGLITHYQAY